MMTQDPELETRLRRYGEVLRTQVRLNPHEHARLMEGVDRGPSVRSHRWVTQLAVAAAMILVGVGAVALLLRVRADQLAKATPAIKNVVPADGATGVPLDGEIQVTFSQRPQNQPSLTYAPSDGRQASTRWDGSTLTVKYSGLHPARRYEVVVATDYSSALAGKGHFEKRWTFTTELGPPSASAGPLIWYATVPSTGPEPQPTNDMAVDWSGTVVGMLHENGNINQSPDGSRLITGANNLIDQTGQLVGSMTFLKGGPGWADDSRQRCQLATADGGFPTGFASSQPAYLFSGPVGSSLHRVGRFGEFGAQIGPGLAACSPLTDRAVVVQNGVMSAIEVWVVQLSSGSVVYHHVYASGIADVLASRDGRFLAEELLSSDAQGHTVYGDTQIRRTSDGAIVGRLSRQAVVAFSWDGSLVVTMPGYQSGAPSEVRLVDWQRNQVLWQHPLVAQDQTGVLPSVHVLAQPYGAQLAIAVGRTSTNGTPDQFEGLWIVKPDGHSQQVVVGQLAPAF